PYDEPIAEEYRKNETAMVQAFKKAGARVLLGSSGIIDTVPHWVKSAAGRIAREAKRRHTRWGPMPRG
ncbi:MAG: hypothetical protein ABI409_05245, partial [Ramlibacter sp.]